MRKYIIPSRDRINNWKNLFIEAFQEEDFQMPLLVELVSIASTVLSNPNGLIIANGNQQLRIDVFHFVADLISIGTLEEKQYDEARAVAIEFVLYMAGYLANASVLSNQVDMTFSGMSGTDMVVNILADGEFDETEERLCLSG